MFGQIQQTIFIVNLSWPVNDAINAQMVMGRKKVPHLFSKHCKQTSNWKQSVTSHCNTHTQKGGDKLAHWRYGWKHKWPLYSGAHSASPILIMTNHCMMGDVVSIILVTSASKNISWYPFLDGLTLNQGQFKKKSGASMGIWTHDLHTGRQACLRIWC